MASLSLSLLLMCQRQHEYTADISGSQESVEYVGLSSSGDCSDIVVAWSFGPSNDVEIYLHSNLFPHPSLHFPLDPRSKSSALQCATEQLADKDVNLQLMMYDEWCGVWWLIMNVGSAWSIFYDVYHVTARRRVVIVRVLQSNPSFDEKLGYAPLILERDMDSKVSKVKS